MPVYQVNMKQKEKDLETLYQKIRIWKYQSDQKCDMLRLGWSKLNLLGINDEDKEITWKRYHEKLLNAELAWHMNCLSQTDKVSNVSQLIDKDIVRVR